MVNQLRSISETLGPVVGLVGGVLGIIALIVTGIKPLYSYVQDRRYGTHPFEIWYESPLRGGHRIGKERTVSPGVGNFFICVQSKRKVAYKRISVAIVNEKLHIKNNRNEPDYPIDAISVLSVSVLRNRQGFQDAVLNGFGGDIYFDPPQEAFPEDSLHLALSIQVRNGPWSGYIMFQAERADQHRGAAYLHLTVTASESTISKDSDNRVAST